jgi:hypothetical protein
MNERIVRTNSLRSVGEYERRVILAHTEDVLRRAEVIDTLPTPLAEVRRAAGINEVVDIGTLPKDISASKPAGLSRIIGAFLFRQRVVFIDGNLAIPRRRFTDAHEIIHSLLPAHARSYLLDDDRIFREVQDYLDLEANVGATYLLFQGHRFHRRALDYATSIQTPKMLARYYGASYHATIRFYVENHPEPVALVITGQYPQSGGRLPVWSWSESPSFIERFGPLIHHVGQPSTNPTRDLMSPVPFARLAAAAATPGKGGSTEELDLEDRNGARNPFLAEAWFNQRVHFLMLVPRRRIPRGRRLNVITS